MPSVQNEDDAQSRRYSSSPEPDKSFKARMQQFQYSPTVETHSPRRSNRFLNRSSPGNTSSPAGSPRKKRSRPTESFADGIIDRGDALCFDSSVVNRDSTTSRQKKRRSTTKQRSAKDPYSPANRLVDSLRPGLTLVCIGLNPGLMTAATGHAYAHPSNRFWHLLHNSGITPRKHIPADTRDLMDLYQIGNTNICERPTRSGDGLSKQELEEGAFILDQKISKFKPEAVVIVGKGIWEAIWMAKKGKKKFHDPDFHWGWQDEEMQLGREVEHDGKVVWSGAKTFVATSTSGLAATLRPAEKLAIWKPLGDWMTMMREKP
ncbi:uracil DNA N-glycosylase Thp1 [Knufia peltigerae]|uniref:Uracil DNA N-glycosylase Thp1 n=1 Tax=Knufia peltigerae TaxID=1002370 RepID=A0AA38XTE7_9EURO|nr:uracil DNA N-glycosylase Thp1 [Knufia peltigerae]